MNKILILAVLFSSSVFGERIRTRSCNVENKANLVSLLEYIKENWRSVDELWDQEGGRRHPGCLKRRLIKNGVVICHRRNFVGPEYHRCIRTNGWSNFGGVRAHFCPSFFDKTEKMDYHNQRACYTGLLFKLHGNNCYKRNRFPETYMTLVEFGFKWYAKYHPVTIDFRDCNF